MIIFSADLMTGYVKIFLCSLQYAQSVIVTRFCICHVVADNHAMFSVIISLKLQAVINSAAMCDNFFSWSNDRLCPDFPLQSATCTVSNCNWISFLPGEWCRHFRDESRGSGTVSPSVWWKSEASFVQRCRPDSSVCTFTYWRINNFQTKATAKVEDWFYWKRGLFYITTPLLIEVM